MKKFLAFLVLVCLTVTGAWADITQVALEELISAAEAAYAANNVGLPGANLITANSQFSSNATETREGNLNNLLDGNLNTYWHSSWASEVDRHVHYLQVALSEAISGQIQMTMGRRSGATNDHPVKMSVEYSVDGSEPYTLLDGQFMEFSATTGYVTGTFNLPTAAKYLRFFNEESNGSYQRGYWHCSEFQLNKLGTSLNETYATEAANMLAALNTAKAITSGATQANIDALQTALNAYKETVAPTYTVIINGATDGKVIYNSTQYGDGETFKAADLEASDLTALALDGYCPADISVSGYIVTVTYEPKSVLCADDVDVTKCYYIYTERGGLGAASADASKVAKIAVSNIDKHDALQQFAFIKYDDNLYLYNVGAKKFVTQSGALSSSCDYAPVLFTDASNNTVRLYYNANKNININSGSYVLFDSWTTKDPGNSFRIFIAEDFDQSEIVEELYNANHIYVDGFNDAMSYTQPRECNYTEITYNRTFNNLDWQALYIPFSLNYDEWKDDFDIAEIFNFMHYDDDDDGNFDRVNLVVMKKTSGSTKPNFPYLIRAKNTGDYSRTYNNKTLQPAESNTVDCSSTLYTYTFTGTYAPLNTMYANGYYAMSGGSLQRANSTSVVLKPQRWYMSITARSGGYASVKAQSIKIVVDGEDETEAIEAPSSSPKGESPVAYDLMGRGVKGAVKGISIMNGKKIIK